MLYLILILAAYFDLKSYRIPNQLILFGYVTGAVYSIFLSESHFIFHFLSAVLVLIMGIPLFTYRIIGGGDIKLFSVCALYLNISRMKYLLCYSFLFAAGYSFFILFLHLLFLVIAYKKEKRKCDFFSFIKGKSTKKIHFGIFILLASLAERFLVC